MTCHACGRVMKRGTRPSVIRCKGQCVTVQQPGWYCRCDEGILTTADIAMTEPAFIELKAQVEGVLPPAAIKAIRKKLRLTQE